MTWNYPVEKNRKKKGEEEETYIHRHKPSEHLSWQLVQQCFSPETSL